MNAEQSVFWLKSNAVQPNFSPDHAFLRGIKRHFYAPTPFLAAFSGDDVDQLHPRPKPKQDVP
jgi:hypothetical protein